MANYPGTKKSTPSKNKYLSVSSKISENIIKSIKTGVIEHVIEEGVDDPGILKMVFLAGGPGSGKGFVGSELFGMAPLKGDKDFRTSFSHTGLKVVNSDTMFVHMLKKHGIDPKDLASISGNDIELAKKIGLTGDLPDSIRNKAKASIDKMRKLFFEGRLGMLIDGTGSNFSKIKKQKDIAEKLGYDTYMIFVNTSLDVALERNNRRSRVVPENTVKKLWGDAQDNMGKFQNLFGSSNFLIVDNSVYGPVPKDVVKAADAFMKRPIKNRVGVEWIKLQRKLKNAGVDVV